MIRSLVIYPVLFAAFPIVSLYQHNVLMTHADVLITPLLLVAAVVPVAWGLVTLLVRNPHRAGLVTSLLVLAFFTLTRLPGELGRGLVSLGLLDLAGELEAFYTLETQVVALTMIAGLMGLACWLSKERVRSWTLPLNVFGAILVVMPLLGAAASWAGTPRELTRIRGTLAHAEKSENETSPDIYYILLDAFGRDDVLREIYGVELAPFLEGLERRGFFVARRSHSNYGQTRLSLASSLNGAYLDDLADPSSADERPLHDLIRDNGAAQALRSRGYSVVAFDTGYRLTENMTADIRLEPVPHLDEFHRELIDMTALHLVHDRQAGGDSFQLSRKRILGTLDALPEIARRPEPTFTFAHVLAPHPPFVFGEDGEEVRQSIGYSMLDGSYYQEDLETQYLPKYRNQVRFLATRVLETVGAILDASPEPPIILIQGDHGPGSRLFQDEPAKTDVRERFSILNAYYLPGYTDRPDALPEGLDAETTPVNSVRILLRTYFGADLPLLPNRSYLSPWNAPYAFQEITDRLAHAEAEAAKATPDKRQRELPTAP